MGENLINILHAPKIGPVKGQSFLLPFLGDAGTKLRDGI